jgi:DNA-directed RNA polymerase subunit delta
MNLNMTMNTLTTTHVNEDGVLVYAGKGKESFYCTEPVLAEAGDVMEGTDYGYGALSIQSAARKKKEEEEDDVVDDSPAADKETADDDWEEGEEGAEEEDEWDPDFDEFDIPKSTKKGSAGKEEEVEEDAKFDEDLNEFDDLFGDGGDDFDDDDDF